jgi:hypothetical protein
MDDFPAKPGSRTAQESNFPLDEPRTQLVAPALLWMPSNLDKH